MTLEEAVAAINELKGQVQDLSREKTKILENRDEILAEKRAAKAEMDAIREQLAALKPDPKTPEKDDKPPANKTTATLQAELEDLRKQLSEKDAKEAGRSIDSAVKDALEAKTVTGALGKAALAMLKAGNEFAITDGVVTMNGLPVADAINKWVDEGDGKSFVAARTNTGAPPASPNSGSPAPGKSRSEMSQAEKGAYIRENGLEAYKKLPA